MKQALLQLAAQAGGPLLGLDTSCSQASLVLVQPATSSVLERELAAATLPSEGVVAAIDGMLQSAELRPEHLCALVVGLGPGSFTGLRVGLATAKGLAFGSNIALYGVSSLELLACEAGPGPVLVVADARRGDFYAALYMNDGYGRCQPVLAEQVLSLAALTLSVTQALGHHSGALRLDSLQVVGDARDIIAEAWDAKPLPVPLRIAHGVLAARTRILAHTPDDLATLVPHYLRTSSVGR